MDEPLLHDPRTKQQIKDALYQHLYAPIQKQFKQRLDNIVTQNTVALGVGHASFLYKGTVYVAEDLPVPRKMNRLLPKYVPVMEEYLNDLKQLNENELPYVLGFITQVLNASNDLQDYLRVFPNTLHRPIEDLINSCPCRAKRLSEETIENLQYKNKIAIQLTKQRMVTNLLI